MIQQIIQKWNVLIWLDLNHSITFNVSFHSLIFIVNYRHPVCLKSDLGFGTGTNLYFEGPVFCLTAAHVLRKPPPSEGQSELETIWSELIRINCTVVPQKTISSLFRDPNLMVSTLNRMTLGWYIYGVFPRIVVPNVFQWVYSLKFIEEIVGVRSVHRMNPSFERWWFLFINSWNSCSKHKGTWSFCYSTNQKENLRIKFQWTQRIIVKKIQWNDIPCALIHFVIFFSSPCHKVQCFVASLLPSFCKSRIWRFRIFCFL